MYLYLRLSILPLIFWMKIELSELSEPGTKNVAFKGMEREEEAKPEADTHVRAEGGPKSPSMFDMFCCCLRKKIISTMFEKRVIRLDGTVYPINTVSNAINNKKYTILGFIPVVLFNQFKYFFNMFFLLLAFSQFIPPLKVGSLCSHRSSLLLRGPSGFRPLDDDVERSSRRYKKVLERQRDQQSEV